MQMKDDNVIMSGSILCDSRVSQENRNIQMKEKKDPGNIGFHQLTKKLQMFTRSLLKKCQAKYP